MSVKNDTNVFTKFLHNTNINSLIFTKNSQFPVSIYVHIWGIFKFSIWKTIEALVSIYKLNLT